MIDPSAKLVGSDQPVEMERNMKEIGGGREKAGDIASPHN